MMVIFGPQTGVGRAPTFLFEMDSLVIGRVWQIAEPLVTDQGMEIVDIEYHREGQGNVLRFYLDRPEGRITIDDLALMSRRLGDLMDVHDTVPGRYTLEVSSPGINRRLRQPAHFRRFIGKRIRVRTLEPTSGRRAVVGLLHDVRADGIVLATADGERAIAFDCIAQANYEHEYAQPQPRRGRPSAR
jgi:ribosome maturation factor RimP